MGLNGTEPSGPTEENVLARISCLTSVVVLDTCKNFLYESYLLSPLIQILYICFVVSFPVSRSVLVGAEGFLRALLLIFNIEPL